MMSEPVLLCWSGGKDSSLALQACLENSKLNVKALLTTITEGYDRISMHGVRYRLLQEQITSIGLPLEEVRIPIQASNLIYEESMYKILEKYKKMGISKVVFGDLFLQDIRSYREKNLAQLEMTGLFPLWLKDTKRLAHDFIRQGFKAILVCIDPKQMNPSFCGREFDEKLLKDLPSSVDPCGENGEFHTFVYDGPIFQYPLKVKKGEIVERDGFWFCDLL
ncbi:MAG: diphthine--ammonia ligase [Chlamydiae bacterium]|nr:diphthine--ammonia ligase [Chlamydiota bacterium]MBI3277267.1 diphthine--ammonia ligase [Chlamydiota bacterium]